MLLMIGIMPMTILQTIIIVLYSIFKSGSFLDNLEKVHEKIKTMDANGFYLGTYLFGSICGWIGILAGLYLYVF